MKALYEYFKDELDDEQPRADALGGRSGGVPGRRGQEGAQDSLARFDGVMIADSVGLGKTWIGKKLLEDFAYHMRQKALVICPASLREMWETELRDATIPAAVISQEELGREEFDAGAVGRRRRGPDRRVAQLPQSRPRSATGRSRACWAPTAGADATARARR